MSAEFSVKNVSGKTIDEEIVEKVTARVKKWWMESCARDNPICIVIQRAMSDRLYGWSYTTDLKERLESGVDLNLLSGSLGREFSQYEKKLKGIFEFNICIGFTNEDIDKLLKKTDAKKKDEDAPVLNVLPIEPKFDMKDVILPEKTQSELDDVVALLQNMKKIYYDWGFIDIDPVPRSVVNLWGPPGTGKTMTVHAVAKKLGKKLLILNYADIESKFVGDAPKNLVSAFEIASKEDAVMFFDEADSFLGKRITNVQQGAEQAINSLRSQMLMKLEEFNGIVFFATNLHENYDRAFESRILKHIEFSLPDVDGRKRIIEAKLPANAPYADGIMVDGHVDDSLLTTLAESIEGFSGREIKNCVLESLVKATRNEVPCVTKEILTNTFKEKKKAMDALKKNETERKEKIKSAIKKKLDEKDYSVHKTGVFSSDRDDKKIEDSSGTAQSEKTPDSTESDADKKL